MRMFFLSLALFCAAPAFAGDDAPAPAEMSVSEFEAVADRLGLSEPQRDKISADVFASRTAKVDIQGRAKKAKLELRRLMLAEPMDEKAVLKAVDSVNAAESDLRTNKIQLLLTIHRQLDAKQWTQLVEIRRERKQERRAERDDE